MAEKAYAGIAQVEVKAQMKAIEDEIMELYDALDEGERRSFIDFLALCDDAF